MSFRFQGKPTASFGTIQVQDGQRFGFDVVQTSFYVDWDALPDKFYTIILYDLSAPAPFIHFLAVNVPGKDFKRGEVLLRYIPPSPPPGSSPHTYVLDVYIQAERIQPVMIQREQFDLNQITG